MDDSVTVGVGESTTSLLPPKGYRTLCIANLILFSISTILCVIMIVSMTLPLLSPKRRKRYSTYNLYLAYLSVPDLIFNAFFVYLVVTRTTLNPDYDDDETNEDDFPRMFDHKFDYRLTTICVAANMYLNSFLTCEVYWLLKKSNAGKRYNPPSIARVTKQAMISYFLGMMLLAFNYVRMWIASEMLTYVLELVFIIGIPFLILIGVCWVIYWQGLFLSTKSMYQGRLRVLTLFMGRIVFVYVLIWVPATVLFFEALTSETECVMMYGVSLLFSGSQVIVTFACSMTKPDTRKLITDVVTFVPCRKQWTQDCEDTSFRISRSLPRSKSNRRLTMSFPITTSTRASSLDTILPSHEENTTSDGQSNVDDDAGSNEVINPQTPSTAAPRCSAEV